MIKLTGYTKPLLEHHYAFVAVNGRGYMGRDRTQGGAILQALQIAINCGEESLSEKSDTINEHEGHDDTTVELTTPKKE